MLSLSYTSLKPLDYKASRQIPNLGLSPTLTNIVSSVRRGSVTQTKQRESSLGTKNVITPGQKWI